MTDNIKKYSYPKVNEILEWLKTDYFVDDKFNDTFTLINSLASYHDKMQKDLIEISSHSMNAYEVEEIKNIKRMAERGLESIMDSAYMDIFQQFF